MRWLLLRVALAAPRPEGTPGPGAEALAARIEQAVDVEAWARTGAVTFTVFGHRYLWDRERNLVRYEDRRGVVLTEGWRPMGRAFRRGVQVGGDWKDRRVRRAYTRFVNDAFWAFAPFKLRDSGAVLSLSSDEDGDGLLVSYGAGGVTPGDAYRWEVGPDGMRERRRTGTRVDVTASNSSPAPETSMIVPHAAEHAPEQFPTAWRMWTAVLPIPGARARWSAWVTLPTGAKVATRRKLGLVGFRIHDLDGAAHLSDLVPGGDPFAPMFGP